MTMRALEVTWPVMCETTTLKRVLSVTALMKPAFAASSTPNTTLKMNFLFGWPLPCLRLQKDSRGCESPAGTGACDAIADCCEAANSEHVETLFESADRKQQALDMRSIERDAYSAGYTISESRIDAQCNCAQIRGEFPVSKRRQIAINKKAITSAM